MRKLTALTDSYVKHHRAQIRRRRIKKIRFDIVAITVSWPSVKSDTGLPVFWRRFPLNFIQVRHIESAFLEQASVKMKQ